MTNNMIILLESVKLMEQGKIKGSGQVVFSQDGKELEIPEEIHTYQAWKRLGFQVKKGSKAVAQFGIWKYINQKPKADELANDVDGELEALEGRCYMKLASFFTKEQVEEVKK